MPKRMDPKIRGEASGVEELELADGKGQRGNDLLAWEEILADVSNHSLPCMGRILALKWQGITKLE